MGHAGGEPRRSLAALGSSQHCIHPASRIPAPHGMAAGQPQPRATKAWPNARKQPGINVHAAVLIELAKHRLGPEEYFSILFSSQIRLKQLNRNFFFSPLTTDGKFRKNIK